MRDKNYFIVHTIPQGNLVLAWVVEQDSTEEVPSLPVLDKGLCQIILNNNIF